RAEPLRALGGARTLQMVSAVSGLFATAQATFAADKAAKAADSAQGAAQAATPPAPAPAPAAAAGSAYIPPSARASRTPDPMHDAQPRPAEAATEISER
ncbi:MAG: protein sip-5, partial [Pseudoxanthomonas sp.]|nr:protein sip-5 [Pseudoxanthomonas sp.]